MALTIFLFKVSNLEFSKGKTDIFADDEEQATRTVSEGAVILFCAKATFRGISLWSNNVPVINGTASFVARGDKPKKFNFNLATTLSPEDRLRLEFFTVNQKKSRKKLTALFEIMLESLVDVKYIDLPEENLSDPNNYLIKALVKLKLYYTPPDIDQEKAALGLYADGEAPVVDWNSTFDDEGRHGGHRFRHVRSKHDNKLKKFGRKIIGRQDDADTDSHTDSDFDGVEKEDPATAGMSAEDKLRAELGNLEILEKSLGRFDGDVYHMQEWQIMVHVIQGRDFAGLDINPYVCVQIDDEKRYTAVHRCTNSPFFGEFFTFDYTLPATHMMEKVIYFKVHHEKRFVSTFTHTKPIGVFKVDVSTIYNEKEHAFERKWAQLVNPESIQVKCGYLLLSVAVAERGVSSKNILGEITQGDDDELKPSKTFVPSAMPRTLFPVQIKIIFYNATELPEMMTDFLSNVSKKIFRSEKWEPIDSYCEVSYNAMRATTDPQNGASPNWREAIYLIGQFPPLVRTLKIALKDHAAVQQDRVIASFLVDLFSISETNPAIGFLPSFGPTWVFLYGSPREYTISKDQDGLGEGMGEGVCYKGRLLMEVVCHPISGEHASNTTVQKEKGVQVPEISKFPTTRTFLLFGCIYDVTMIDKSFGNATICFEISIGSSGYLSADQLMKHELSTSITRPYPRIPVDNDSRHFRLPIDLQKPMIFTKYTFHDYSYRMQVSNRLKRASQYMTKLIREFEANINSKASNEVLLEIYRKMEQYVHSLPCGCADQNVNDGNLGVSGVVHSTLSELLSTPRFTARMNVLDEKRQKKIAHNLESLKAWISKDIEFDEEKKFETVKQLNKIARAFKQLAFDAQSSLPDIFLWMICDSKRVAYARLQPEDLLYSSCNGEKGLNNGRVQTLFLQTPRTSDKAIKSTMNAKVQIYLWLGIEEQQPFIFKQLPTGFEMPPLPLSIDHTHIRYNGRSFYELRCHCYKARSLIASDETGFSDPFLSITAGNETQTTPILKESLCPQWNITLVFRNLMHVGSRETAEEIIGNVVCECYDYDDSGDGSDLIGRFSTTAELDLFTEEKRAHESAFRWYEFKMGDKTAGELLALFELVEVNPETRQVDDKHELDEVEITPITYPPENYVLKLMKNKIYHIPDFIIPESKPYEIEVLFWGLRECRPIGLQAIQQAEVSIECAGARITKKITDVQKNPNFECSRADADKYKLLVRLPKDNNFWPHISIYCVQTRFFGLKEVVGNLVVTNIQQYIEKPNDPLSPDDEATADAVNKFAKNIPQNFNRIRRSIVDAYEATIVDSDKDGTKQTFLSLDKSGGHKQTGHDSEKAFIGDDQLKDDESEETSEEHEGHAGKDLADSDGMSESGHENQRVLTDPEKEKLIKMEKSANWWSKYYASKAKLKLEKKPPIDLDEMFQDSLQVYADFFTDDNKTALKIHQIAWNKAKQAFIRAKTARKQLKTLAALGMEQIGDLAKGKSIMDAGLDLIETDRLKELALLQTFDFVETELEKVNDYENFTDCLDKFPLYKGKGTSRSDEIGDESRVYTKFKGKFRIREIPVEDLPRKSVANARISRASVSPAALTGQFQAATTQPTVPGARTHDPLLNFNFNQNRITLKCRLYIIKALLFRAWDSNGKADPYIKICLNNDVIIDDVKSRKHNTLEPIFGKSHEFELTIPQHSLLRIQIWDWDLSSIDDMIAETSIDVENRWLSCHRATCGLPRRYDSAGYNTWRDTKRPETVLNDLCKTSNLNLPVYSGDHSSLAIGDIRFNCDPECVKFVKGKKADDLIYRKAHHESPEHYIKQNTALAALHGWGKKVDPKGVLVAEHIESRSLVDPKCPDVEQGKLEMWLDFFPMSRPPSSAPIDITPPVPVSYQLRVTILNTTDVELEDENFITGEKSSDIYVKAWILGENVDAQQTDVHYRSLTGEGNFNWRFIYDFDYIHIEERIIYEKKESILQIGTTVKRIPPRLIIRVYDADLISADDFLGECILNLTHLPIGAKNSNKCKADMLFSPKHKAVNIFEVKRSVGWWPMIAPLKAGEIRGEDLIGGKVEAEFSLVTAEEAVKNPVGREREAPSPLPPPNRPDTSFLWFTSPFKTFKYVLWRNYKWYIIIGILLIIAIIFLLLGIWATPPELIHQIFTKIFNTGGSGK